MSTEKYIKIHDDIKKIMFKDLILNDRLEQLKTYAENFIDETDRGSLRTVLVNLKSFKHNPIITEIGEKLNNRLKFLQEND